MLNGLPIRYFDFNILTFRSSTQWQRHTRTKSEDAQQKFVTTESAIEYKNDQQCTFVNFRFIASDTGCGIAPEIFHFRIFDLSRFNLQNNDFVIKLKIINCLIIKKKKTIVADKMVNF